MLRLDSNMLHQAVKSVIPGLPTRRNLLPIIDNILISGNGKLELSATNLEIAIERTLNIQSEQDFTACIPGKTLERLSKNASGEVTLSTPETGKLHMEDAKGSQDVSTWGDSTDFPSLPFAIGSFVAGSHIQVKNFIDTCKPLLDKTGDDGRYNLDCLQFNKGRVEATDGHRLAFTETSWIPETIKTLVPYDSMKRVLKSLETIKRGNPEIIVDFHSEGILINADELTIRIKARQGDYPDINKALPQKTGDPCIFDKTELIKALKLVGLMASTRNRCIKILVENGKATLRCDNPDLGHGQTRVNYSGSPQMRFVGINVDYLMDALKSQSSEHVAIQITAGRDAILVNDEVIMPMRDGCMPEDRDRMRESYKSEIPELTPDQEHDWLADVPEQFYEWRWNRKGSMFAGSWRRKAA